MNDVTQDLGKFGNEELFQAGELLKELGERGINNFDFLGNGLTLSFNFNSGKVFLSDEDFNVGVIEHDDENKPMLVQFYSCPICGFEGTQTEAESEAKDFEEHNGFCSQSCEDENEGK